jgi:HSP20 family protein
MPGALTRWDPFAELADLRSRFDRVFGDDAEPRRQAWMPAVDVVRDDGALVLRADIPGIKPEEITIQVEDDVLTVSGAHEESTEEKEEDYVRRERRLGSFTRSMTLPRGVDASKIEAQTRHGVLEVRIPVPEEPRKTSVEITPTAG